MKFNPFSLARPRSDDDSVSPEAYRVGQTLDGQTTLTLIGTSGDTMTLHMSATACKQLIRMLSSTLEGTEL